MLRAGAGQRMMLTVITDRSKTMLSSAGSFGMRIESDGHSRGNPRLYELIEHAPKTGKSPTVWAWPELIDYLKIAGQPVAGPWPPHQEPRPDPDYDSLPVAVPDPEAPPRPRPDSEADSEAAAAADPS